MTVRICLLGPVVVRDAGGRPVDIGGPSARAPGEQLGGPGLGVGAGKPEQPADHDQVLPAGAVRSTPSRARVVP